MKEKIIVSACLLGTPCRYDGKSKPCSDVIALSDRYEILPVCPEVDGGLSTPRLPCEIIENKVIRSDGMDMTKEYLRGANLTLALAKNETVSFCVLKEKSPSCGKKFRYDGSFTNKLIEKPGITASLLMENDIIVYSENEIADK